MNDSDRAYEIVCREIDYSGVYLVKNKYKYIRLAYMFFFTGLTAGIFIFFVENFL